MKYSEELVKEMVLFVEENGLMDYGGCTLKAFCEHFGITKDSYYDWLEKSTFSTAIKDARAVFKAKVEKNIVQSLYKSAMGYSTEKKHIEEWTNKDGSKKTKKVIDQTEVAPNVAAGIFLLTNINNEQWSNRQYNQIDAKVDAKVSRYNLDALDDAELFDLADKIQDNANSTDNQG